MAEQGGVGQVPLAPTDNQQTEEEQQEQLLRAKYGGLLPKKKLLPKDNKYFDSADWQMNKQQGEAAIKPQPKLEPKLQPTCPPPRRQSQLGDAQ